MCNSFLFSLLLEIIIYLLSFSHSFCYFIYHSFCYFICHSFKRKAPCKLQNAFISSSEVHHQRCKRRDVSLSHRGGCLFLIHSLHKYRILRTNQFCRGLVCKAYDQFFIFTLKRGHLIQTTGMPVVGACAGVMAAGPDRTFLAVLRLDPS